MKTLVIGLDGASPDLLFGDERLSNIRLLMDAGCYGPLESPIPSTAVPAWICMAMSRDPGSLGIYGLHARSAGRNAVITPSEISATPDPVIWELLATQGKRSATFGVPVISPTGLVNGVHIGCFLGPQPHQDPGCSVPEVSDEIQALISTYPLDVPGWETLDTKQLLEAIYTTSQAQFEVVREVQQRGPWEYLQFVEIGLDRLQHRLWHAHDPSDRRHRPDDPYRDAIRQYYAYLDGEIGKILELIDNDTIVLIASTHGAASLDGAVHINEWLVQQGLLVLDEYPDTATPLSHVKVNWAKTRAWAEGGDYAHIFFNVRGRESEGNVELDQLDQLRDDLATRLKSIVDGQGESLVTATVRPSDIYTAVRGVAPELIVCFRDLRWSANGEIGGRCRILSELDPNHARCANVPTGCFVLAAPGSRLDGEIARANVLDLAPTLLELSGYPVPSSMQGRSLVADTRSTGGAVPELQDDEEELIRERLRGLGYIG